MNGRESIKPSYADDAFDGEELLALARLDIEKGNAADALWRLKRATAGGNVPRGAYSLCGLLYLRLGLGEHALTMLQKHLERHPEAVDERFSMGLALASLGRGAEAINAWTEVLEKQPRHSAALYYRALLRARDGQLGLAKRDAETLLQSSGASDSYMKVAKELAQSIDARQDSPAPLTAAPPTAAASTPDWYASFAAQAYAGAEASAAGQSGSHAR